MNLPAINNKMKNQNNQFKQDNSQFGSDGFGLGIQVFKIQSVKNIDANIKSKNRTMIKNIQNPNQTTNYKQPLVPKHKKLPSLQKSHSQINAKQRISAFMNSKVPSDNLTGYSDKIMQKKSTFTQSNTIVTPVSYSMRKKVAVSSQKGIYGGTVKHNNQKKSSIIDQYSKNAIIQAKQRPPNKVTAKLNQTAPPQTLYKTQQTPYFDYHRQNRVLTKFYSQLQTCQKQHLKQIKQLKRLKQNEQNEQVINRINYLLSTQGKIQTIVQNNEKNEYEQKIKQLTKHQQKKNKKLVNSIVPISGFLFSQMDLFEYDGIDKYVLGDFKGSFDIKTYENVDLAPNLGLENKEQQDDQ